MGFFKKLTKYNAAIGVDLGTCNTLIYFPDKGVVCNEPSVVAIERGTKQVLAVGLEAKRMLWRTPENVVAVRPLRDGVIADLETTEIMIRYFIRKLFSNRLFFKPRMVIGIPSSVTEVERKAVEDCAVKAGAREVEVVEESLVAAIGAGIPIQEPAGHMVCDIGGGTTEISVISLGGMVLASAIRVGGDKFDAAIQKYVRSIHNLQIGARTAEELKIKIGNVYTEHEIEKMEVKGTDVITGLPRRLDLDSLEIREALLEPVSRIVEEVKKTLSQTPPELASDIIERGIVLTGGGALLKGMSRLISREAFVPVFVAENPMLCVVLGAGRYHQEMETIYNRRDVFKV